MKKGIALPLAPGAQGGSFAPVRPVCMARAAPPTSSVGVGGAHLPPWVPFHGTLGSGAEAAQVFAVFSDFKNPF